MNNQEELIAEMHALRAQVESANQTAREAKAQAAALTRQSRFRSFFGMAALIAALSIVGAPKAAAQFGVSLASLQAQIDTLKQKTRFLSVSGTDTVFRGTNVYVQSGSGATDGPLNGLGNLIVGYNEATDGFGTQRNGSNNLIVGTNHNYTSYGGAVFGMANEIDGAYGSVTGGSYGFALDTAASVSGGTQNVAQGPNTAVSGGQSNFAIGDVSSISGGINNVTFGRESSISGGESNFEKRPYGWRASFTVTN